MAYKNRVKRLFESLTLDTNVNVVCSKSIHDDGKVIYTPIEPKANEVIQIIKRTYNNESMIESKTFSQIDLESLQYLNKRLSNTQLGMVLRLVATTEMLLNLCMINNQPHTYKTLPKLFVLTERSVRDHFKKLIEHDVVRELTDFNGHKKVFALNPYLFHRGKVSDAIIQEFSDLRKKYEEENLE